MKRILVTGGAGFIGSHLCRRLVHENNKVICLDNLFTGSPENIQDLMDNKNFRFVFHDITNAFMAEVDEIYHLACPASPVHYQENPVQTLKTSVLGALHMLELARAENAKILFSSTSEVYGDPLVHPQPESYWGNVNPIGIRSCYDEGKRAAETLCMDYQRQHNIKIKIIRIFNTYGPNMCENDGRVVSNFIVQSLKGNPLTVYGEGSQTRSFMYVDDLLEGMIRMMDTENNFHGPVNLGNPVEYTIKQLAETIIRLTGSGSKIIYFPLPGDDPRKRKPDIRLAYHKLSGWKPEVSLAEGLIKTINYFDMEVIAKKIYKKKRIEIR